MDNIQQGHDLPLVSVIIPTFNNEEYLGDCIASVLDQDYPNMEIIIVDDGSTDNTRAVVEQFEEQVRYFIQENSGSAVARNRAIDESCGSFIAFCDSDDLWAPGRLREQVAFLEDHPEYGVVTGNFSHVDANFKLNAIPYLKRDPPPSIIRERSGWVYHTLFESSWYHIIAALVRRDVISKTRFNASFRRGQDYDFWLQLAHYAKIAKLDSLYAYYRKNEASISHKPHLRNYRAEIIEHNLNKFGSSSHDGRTVSSEDLQSIFHQVWFEYGYELYLAAWYKKALPAFLQARNYAPGRISSYKFILRCIPNLLRDQSPS